MAGKLRITVLYDRWEPEDENAGANGKAPLVRTLDKKEVETEVVDALTKLGHEPALHELDGSFRSLHALAKLDSDIIFNLSESFGGNDTADYNIAAYIELIGKRFTGAGSHGLMLAQDKSVAKKIFAFHGISTPVFARSFRGRLAFSHELHFPVIVKPMREDGSIGIEFDAVVSSIGEMVEPHQVQELVDLGLDLRLRLLADREPERDVVAQRHVLERCVVLEDEPDPTLLRRQPRVASVPETTMVPPSGTSSPAITRRSVDLPEPDRPEQGPVSSCRRGPRTRCRRGR